MASVHATEVPPAWKKCSRWCNQIAGSRNLVQADPSGRLSAREVELQVPELFFLRRLDSPAPSPGLRRLERGARRRSQVRFVTGANTSLGATPPSAGSRAARPAAHAARAGRVRGLRSAALSPRHTFSHFVVGGAARSPTRLAARWPSVGHRLQPAFALAAQTGNTSAARGGVRLLQRRADARVCYARQATNEMIYAIQHAQTHLRLPQQSTGTSTAADR